MTGHITSPRPAQINKSTMPFAQRENISAFCDAARSLGVKDINNFTADDLFEVSSPPPSATPLL